MRRWFFWNWICPRLYRLQNLDSQEDRKKFGCEKVFTDPMSGAKSNRPGLETAIEFVRSEDILVVWWLDRLGRNSEFNMLPSPHKKAPPLECFSIVALREITLFAAGSLLGFATTSYSLIVFLLNPYFPYNYRFFCSFKIKFD